MNLKRRLIAIFLLLASLTLSACSDTMREQDHEFLEKIKTHLKVMGDEVVVSDIHPGEWLKVCFTNPGAYSNPVLGMARTYGLEEKDIRVINRDRDEVYHGDDFKWGIFFIYSKSEIEYFVIGNSRMSRFNIRRKDHGCLSKEEAAFQHTGRYGRKIDEPQNSFFTISLIQKTKR